MKLLTAEDVVRQLEKTYNAHLVTAERLRAEATAFYHWVDELCRFEQDSKLDVKDLAFSRCLIFERTREQEKIFTVHIFTDRFRYQITATPRDDSRGGYLGCIMTCRKPEVGEEGHRGSDLPDGNYYQDTWRLIQAAIIRNEMVKLECFPKPEKEYSPLGETARMRDYYKDLCTEHGHGDQLCRKCEGGTLDELHRAGVFGGPEAVALDADPQLTIDTDLKS